MTTTRDENLSLERETLYMEWRQDREQATPRSLKYWIAEYPSFADDFVTWASELPLMTTTLYRFDTTAEEERLGKVGRSVVAEMRARYGMARPALTSLTEAARERNLRLRDVAERVGVGVPIVSKLEQRLLKFATLPETLIQKLAETLELGTEAVREYLRQPPTLAAGAAYQYTGKAAPSVTDQQDFAEAIRSCPGMSDADKQAWLTNPQA